MRSEPRYSYYDLIERITETLALAVLVTAVGITFNESMIMIIATTLTMLPVLLFPFAKNYATISALYLALALITYSNLNSLGFISELVVMVGVSIAVSLTVIQLPAWSRYLLVGVYYVLVVASSAATYSLIYMIFSFLLLMYITIRAYNGPLQSTYRYPSWVMYILSILPLILILLSQRLKPSLFQASLSILASFVLTIPMVKSSRLKRALAIALSSTSLIFIPQASLLLIPALATFRKVRYHRGVPPPETWVDAWIGGRYYVEKVIDTGGFSYVLLGRYGNEKYAIKVLRYTSPSNTPLASDLKVVQSFKREMTSYLLVNSDRVVKVYEIHINEDKLPYRNLESYLEDPPYIVMDYMEYGSLRRYLREKGKLSVGEAVRIAYEVAIALKELHSMGMLHLDLKPENVLFKDKNRRVVKLGDLGASRVYAGQSVEISQFSLAYSAPEVLMNKAATDRADVYSLGLIMYEMLMGFNPQQYILRGITPPMDPHIPPLLTDIILRSLSMNPQMRPSIDEVITVLSILTTPLQS
ncbi:serine/threonine-protein kinase [Caldivirga maquilingensis]|uniref:Protein kinase n=1 Tax=Caldivirga maquilingensis (strain ATCC 700844 / DSM 13496 / JCM 10307 / IC-167) TaxID=397948 RepID=A8MDV3_CALMQ|nr:serine/threonine-protein kinase [Caldivirga maquilingensis]ABW01959.1 protein kinase [Caldivirga maquilingensis IC-167]